VDSHHGFYMKRLKSFEEKCHVLFAPLDLSPPTGFNTTARLDDWFEILPTPNPSLEFGSGDHVGSGGHSITESTSSAEGPVKQHAA
jgi:hypothetical protein